MFEKILNFLGLIDNADMIYENTREEKKEEPKKKRNYNFSDGESFPKTKKEAKKITKEKQVDDDNVR